MIVILQVNAVIVTKSFPAKIEDKMQNHKNELLQKLAIFLNVILVTAPFMRSWFIYYYDKIYKPFYYKGNWVIIGIFVVIYTAFGKLYDGFLVSLVRISEMVYSQSVAAIMSDGLMYLIITLLARKPANPLPFIPVVISQIGLSALWSHIAHRWYFRVFPAKETAIVYDVRMGLEELISEYGLEKKFEIKKIIHIDDCLENTELLKDVETVFLSGVHSSERNVVLKYCIFHDIDVYVIPRIGDLIMSGAKKMHLFHLPMLSVKRYSPSFVYLSIKRFMDIAISLIALIVAGPVMAVTALAIKLTDGGPVFYTQDRLTKDGKIFKIHKFRSMRVDAEKDGVARLSTGDNDERITPIGRFIRKVRIDELPQLWDILVGNLTLVGPRPERPEISAQYEEAMPEFALRLQAKAGLTGYRQVYGKYNTTPYDKLQMDLMYISNPSLVLDMQIILATIKILFMPESTEGIDKDRINALIEEKGVKIKKETVEN